MLRIAVLDDHQRVAQHYADWRAVQTAAEVVFLHEAFESEESAAAQLLDFDVVCLMRERTPFPKTLIERLPRLKLIVLTGKNSRTLDMAAARARGVAIETTDNGPEEATSELAMALILGSARHIAAADRTLKEGGWLAGVPVGRVLSGSTLGLIGVGKVGRRVARCAQAFGMRVIGWSPNFTQERAREAGVEFTASKDELLCSADVVSIHLVLSPQTAGIVSASELALMKRSAILVNTSRGPLVDEDDLIDALQRQKIAGAALDVFDKEPLAESHPLRKLNNVLLTPHVGYVTHEYYYVFYGGTVAALQRFIEARAMSRAGAG